MKTSNVLIGLIAGLAAGAAIGILLAPDSGSETRDKLSQSLKDLGELIKDRAAEEVSKLADLKDSVLDKVKATDPAAEWQGEGTA